MEENMKENILVINPGSTSTKIAVYQGSRSLFHMNITHTDKVNLENSGFWDNYDSGGSLSAAGIFGHDIIEFTINRTEFDTCGAGVVLNASSYIIIDNNSFTDLDGTVNGLRYNDGVGLENNNEHIMILNNEFDNCEYPIDLDDDLAAETITNNLTITKNNFIDNTDSIYLESAENLTMYDNELNESEIYFSIIFNSSISDILAFNS